MAMVYCPECKEKVSDKAVFCPHCGCPISETSYEIKTGSSDGSSFSSFLAILAWITWIGGLIIAIAGAKVTVQGYYSSSTEFHFGTFLTLFLPFIIDGVILMGLSSMAEKITETRDMINGLKLLMKTKMKEGVKALEEDPADIAAVARNKRKLAEGWVKDDSGLWSCPKCGMTSSIDLIRERNACPRCAYEFHERKVPAGTESADSSGSLDNPDTDEYGWIIDEEDSAFVHCPNCGKKVSADYMKFREVCVQCGYKHIQ